MPFGLSNSPSALERLIECVLTGLQWNIFILYLDDILTLSPTIVNMIENLKTVYQCFEKAKSQTKAFEMQIIQNQSGIFRAYSCR